jgi:hypothetical protein
MAFARHQFELSAPQEDGESLLTHLQVVWEKTDQMPKQLRGPSLPEGLESLWSAFLQLHESRGSTGWGPQRITFTDMDAHSRMTGTVFAPWQIYLIRKADNIWLAEFAPKPKETT